MIKRFIRRVLGLESPGPQRVPQAGHRVTRNAISNSALKVCDVLAGRGFSAYVVGGAVRDILLDIEPKDFDVATDARPEQIKPLFRRALVIGRRFRLVHVMLGPETIEVSTFRAADSQPAEKDEHGRVLRDNVFGSLEEDARRRDFTVNALFMDPFDGRILDYVGGQDDLRARLVRCVGDPAARLDEDALRLLRAVRFACALDFELESATQAAVRAHAANAAHVAAERVRDEFLRMLAGPDPRRAIALLDAVGLLAVFALLAVRLVIRL